MHRNTGERKAEMDRSPNHASPPSKSVSGIAVLMGAE
jgi:hypothetical protein